MTITSRHGAALTAAVLALALGLPAAADPELLTEEANVTVDREEDGRYYTVEDIPTFNIDEDGTVDWLTFSGFRRYHSECHVCHGPDGEGSTYAPPITPTPGGQDLGDQN